MAAQKLLDFEDIYSAVLEAIGEQTSNTNALNKVKRYVNMVYIDEIVSYKEWKWLRKTTNIVHKAAFNDDTVTVTPNSTTITFATAPGASLGSFLDYKFAVDGFDEIYTISAHTAGSASATLSSEFQGDLSSTATFKVWRDRIDLPTDCLRTFQIDHNRLSRQMKGVGLQELQKIMKGAPRAEGFPSYYHTTDFYDPSSGDGETESDRYRQAVIWPAILETENVTLHVDYLQQATELDSDADEPLMPLEDRSLLFHGAVSYAWRYIARNTEEAELAWRRFEEKRTRMAGELEDGYDAPKLSVNNRYRNQLRRSRVGSFDSSSIFNGGVSSSSGANPNITFAEDITIKGATFTGNATFNSGISACFSGLTAGSLLFLDASKCITEDNAGLSFDDSTNTLSTGILSLSGNATVGGTLTVTSSATLSGTLGVTGAATLSSTLGVTGVSTLSDNLIIDNAKEIRFEEETANGDNYTGFKAPASLTTNIAYTLPSTAPSAGQYLQSDGSNVLSWQTINSDTVSAAGNVDFNFVDEDTTDNDNGIILRANATDTGSGTEDVDFSIIQQIAGAEVASVVLNADGAGAGAGSIEFPAGHQVLAPQATTGTYPEYSFAHTQTSGIYATGSSMRLKWSGSDKVTIAATAVTFNNSTLHDPGSAGTPGISFDGDVDTGIFRVGADNLGVTTGGTERLNIDSTDMSMAVPVHLANYATGSLPGSPSTGSIAYDSTTNKLVTYNGSSWVSYATALAQSEVNLHTANGHGSTATKIRRFTTAVTNTGSDITYADSATAGGTFTVNTAGIYAIHYADNFTGASRFGITLNVSSTTTDIISVADAEVLSIGSTENTDRPNVISWTGYLSSSDVVRAHTQGVAPSSEDTTFTHFSIVRVA